MISALKQAENGDGLTLRVYNTTDQTLPLTITTILPVKNVTRTQLNENPIEQIDFDGQQWSIDIGGKKLETFVLKLK